jgi:hypothetical protein
MISEAFLIASLIFPKPYAQVSLTDLVMVVHDTNQTYVFPIGVGAMDSKNKSLTPELRGYLQYKHVILKRKNPSYFQGKPFIRLLNKRKGYTPQGIHTTPFSKLSRGYVSHGCIHLRAKDLNVLLQVLKKEKELPIIISYDKLDVFSSYPTAKSYYKIKNFGVKKNPVYKRDKNKLLILEQAKLR